MKKELIREKLDITLENEKRIYQEIIDYRTLLRNSFKDYLQFHKPLDEMIKITNEILIKSHTHPQLSKKDNSFVLQFLSSQKVMDNIFLTNIAIEVVNLIDSKEFNYLKKCDNHKCSLYFIDTSRNHSRRWCSMEICGNRTKVSKFNKRKKDLI